MSFDTGNSFFIYNDFRFQEYVVFLKKFSNYV